MKRVTPKRLGMITMFETPWSETYPGLLRDHGYYVGHVGKWYPHQESIRVPLIIHDPRMVKDRHGTTHDAFTLNVDLAPTILAAAGIQAPARMQGQGYRSALP